MPSPLLPSGRRSVLAPALALALTSAPPLAAQTEGSAAIGEVVPDLEFEPRIGGRGRMRLSDFFGQPVLLAGWRTHLVDGFHAGRVAFDLYEDFGKGGLELVMFDRNPWRDATSADSAAAFWYQTARFLPLLTSSPGKNDRARGGGKDLAIDWPVARDDRSAVLVGVDGRLIAVDSVEEINAKKQRGDYRARLRSLIKQEVQRRKNGWGEDPVAKQARALAFGKDQLAGALAALGAAAPGDDRATDERQAVTAEIQRAFESRQRRLQSMIATGWLVRADTFREKLLLAVAGHAEWEGSVEQAAEFLASSSGKAELRLDKKLTKMLAPLIGEPIKGRAKYKLLADLRIFAAKHAGTKVADKARRLDYLVQSLLCSAVGMRWDELTAKTKKLTDKAGI